VRFDPAIALPAMSASPGGDPLRTDPSST
jgi:hypothetical protein